MKNSANLNHVSISKKDLYQAVTEYVTNLLKRNKSKMEKVVPESIMLNKDGTITLKCQTVELFANKVRKTSEETITLPTNVVIVMIILNSLSFHNKKESMYLTIINLEGAVKSLKVISPGNLTDWDIKDNAISFAYSLLEEIINI